MTEQPDRLLCLKCRRDGQSFRYLDLLERVRLADDPADPDVGHFCLETIHPQKCAIGSDLNPAPRGATVASMTKSRHRHRSELADLAQGVAKG